MSALITATRKRHSRICWVVIGVPGTVLLASFASYSSRSRFEVTMIKSDGTTISNCSFADAIASTYRWRRELEVGPPTRDSGAAEASRSRADAVASISCAR